MEAGGRLRLAGLLLAASLSLSGCASGTSDLEAMNRTIDLERFMGDWFVVASIPIDLPFFSEAEAYGAVETYRLNPDGRIDITYTFRDGGFDGRRRVMRQRGRVYDLDRGTEWRVQLLWPFESAYLIAWLDPDYRRAIIGVPSRRYVWLLSRDAVLTDSELAESYERIARLGYDTSRLRRVPQRAGGE